jgi:hypothetical protein
MRPSHPRVVRSDEKDVDVLWPGEPTIWAVVESVVDPEEMRASAEQMVRILIDLRDFLNRPDGIYNDMLSRIPFGENNPSGNVYDLRVQAQDALQRAQRNLVVQAGQVKKIIDAIFVAIGEYEGIDIANDEQMKRLTGQLAEIQGMGQEAPSEQR